MTLVSEKRISNIFKISLLVKVTQGSLEVIIGSILLFISTNTIIIFIEQYTNQELIENPHDSISTYISQVGHHLSVGGKTFTVFYLLSHGLIKLFLVIGLFKKKLWAYYAFIIILGLFVLYQIYRYSITYSVILLVFTLFDILLVYLTWHESKILKRYLKEQKN